MFRDHARAIWQAAVDAANPRELVRTALCNPIHPIRLALDSARRIVVVGAGKAGGAMCQGVEDALAGPLLERVEGFVNVPDPADPPSLRKLVLHPARPVGSNHPTARGVAGADRILSLLAAAAPDDVALCLLSGGGSALLPAPAEVITLEDKQQVTRLLHSCGATINEMNAVRKHLSRVKGGRLAQAFRGRALFSLIVSDVIGDPLDVIASGPTAADPTTFADAFAVLEKYGLLGQTPPSVIAHLKRAETETLKHLPANVHNLVLGNNARSLQAAACAAEKRGFRVMNLGAFIEGETAPVAVALAGVARSILIDGQPLSPPACLLSGGETTVTLGPDSGKGGRNQEFVLAAGLTLDTAGPALANRWLVLSGGTDGEDGPTDAAGALADSATFQRADALGLAPRTHLRSHDAYPFFEAVSDLLVTGLTHTNVMDVRIFLLG